MAGSGVSNQVALCHEEPYRRTDSSHDRDDVSFHDGNSNRRGRDDLGRGCKPVGRTLGHKIAKLQRIQQVISRLGIRESESHFVERRDGLVSRRVLIPRGPQWFSIHLC